MNKINVLVENTSQQMNNHIIQNQHNRKLLKQIIMRDLIDLYRNVKNITELFINVLSNNISDTHVLNYLDEYNKYITNIKCTIKILDKAILQTQLEMLYNNIIVDIPHDGHGNIIFASTGMSNDFLTKDMYHEIIGPAIDIANLINNSNNNSPQIADNLEKLTKICSMFSGRTMLPKSTIYGNDYSNDDPNIIKFNRKFNYNNLHQQTNGIFTLDNNIPETVTFTEVMTYFSNKVGIQLLQVIHNIIRD